MASCIDTTIYAQCVHGNKLLPMLKRASLQLDTLQGGQQLPPPSPHAPPSLKRLGCARNISQERAYEKHQKSLLLRK